MFLSPVRVKKHSGRSKTHRVALLEVAIGLTTGSRELMLKALAP
jgi:hypothetical protein